MTEQVNETQAPQLGLNDLTAAIQIIDVCAKRGAFEGAELESVGAVRGRLAAFVRASAPPQEEPEGEEPAETPEEETAE